MSSEGRKVLDNFRNKNAILLKVDSLMALYKSPKYSKVEKIIEKCYLKVIDIQKCENSSSIYAFVHIYDDENSYYCKDMGWISLNSCSFTVVE